MKRFLFVSLVLGWAISARADVLVYDMKASNTGFAYAVNTWTQIKSTDTAFLIVELPAEDGNTANVHAVYTWKSKDNKNYAIDVNIGMAIMGSATLGGKEIGLLVDANAHTGNRLQLSGDNKPVTIGKKTNKSCLSCHTGGAPGDLQQNCPPSLTGYRININDAGSNNAFYTSTLSLKLDVAKTLAAHPGIVTAEDEAAALISDLRNAGYTIVP